jgi:hypothetical protein
MKTSWPFLGPQSYEVDESNSLSGVGLMMCNSYRMNDTDIKVRA